jgi:peptide/nickel transport system substrate-binding protein
MRCAAIAVGTVAVAAAALLAAGTAAQGARGPAARPASPSVLRAGIPDNPDHLDTGFSYATEGWEILESTNDGLLRFRPASGAAGGQIVPDLATAMPRVSDHGLTYTFHMRTGVRFSPPVNRAVQPSDIKFAIERLFRVDSGGVGFYAGIRGASRYAKTRKGGISGIVANDRRHTVVFHLTKPDGTFLDYIAIPFADAVPVGTPDKEISTIDRWRIATGPYRIATYVPKQRIVLERNPNFHQWTKNRPNAHLDRIDITIGITPEQAVNETASGQLDWYFEAVAGDRLREVEARYPKQVSIFSRNNITYFELNHRKPPFDKLAVRQALNYAVDRNALVKIFGGQGTPTENILPPTIGRAYRPHHFYPYDLAKAKALVQASGDAGMAVTVESHSVDPVPKAAQYLASVLDQLGFHATVKTLDESVYWDTISTQAGDPQVAFVQFDQDYPEAQDFIDVQLNGERIANVGNQVHSNVDITSFNRRIDAARAMPPGPRRDAAWAKLDADFMRKDASWVPFMNRTLPKFYSPKLRGLVFNGTYYEMFPLMSFAH